MKMIVGLGNPGKEYEKTRHNMGFFYVDEYLKTRNIDVTDQKQEFIKAKLNNVDILFVKPQKYMNLSGIAVRKYVDFYKINIKDILIISDDLDMEVGKYKLKAQGTSGGHNGLKSIEEHLGTTEYNRLKIGISNDKNVFTADYVLSKMDKESKEKIKDNIDVVCNILDDFITMDFDTIMNKYNRK